MRWFRRRSKPRMINDGFGMWVELCDREDCQMHVVRPGKARCYECDER